MTEKVSPELIRRQAAELQRLTIEAGRNEELAAEVNVFNDALHTAAWMLEDDDEPASFPRALIAGMRRREGTR